MWDQSTDIPVTDTGYTATGDITFTLNHVPTTGTDLMVVKNTGLDFIEGTFNNLAQSQAVTLSFGGKDYPFVANYYGGSGNDLVLVWGLSRLMAWGYNGQHQLGAEVLNYQDSTVPVAVSPLGDLAGKFVTAVATGNGYSLALSADGQVFAWGQSMFGALGVSSMASDTPVLVGTGTGLAGKKVIAISAAADTSMALTSEGKIYRWGLFSSSNNKTPIALESSGPGVLQGKKVVKISQGTYNGAALCSDGTLATWGSNSLGQLGINSRFDNSLPVAVDRSGALSGKTIIDVAVNLSHTLILCSDGKVYACGWRYLLGNGGGASDALVPVPVSTAGVLAGKTVTAVAAGRSHSLVLCSDGTLATWGNDEAAQPGKSGPYTFLPTAVPKTGVLAGKTPVGITCGADSSHVLCSDGTVVAWGMGPLGGSYSANIQGPTALQTPALAPGEKLILAKASESHALGIVAKPLPSGLPGPAITVLDADGKTLTDGSGISEFGNVGPQVAVPRTFTLKNTGTLPLSNIVIRIDGVNKANFSLMTAPATTVQPGASTSFVVTAKHFDAGWFTADLHIASNDTTGGVFDIALRASSTVSLSFAKAVVIAEADLEAVDVPITIVGGPASGESVMVTSTNGTATEADFYPINERITFAIQGATATVRVRLIPNAHARADEAFTLTLSNPEGAALGTLTTTTVKIVNVTDSIKPTVAITTPAQGASVAVEGVRVTGVAKDNHGLKKILLSLNGGEFHETTYQVNDFIPTGTTSQNYEAILIPPVGPNTIEVKAVDLYGNESVVKRSFAFLPFSPITAEAEGPGCRVVLPIAADKFRAGVSYTVTAIPAKDYVFVGWQIGPITGTGVTPAMLTQPRLTFVHQLRLGLIARFAPNPFTPAITGTYTGLVQPEAPSPGPSPLVTVAGNDTVGWLTAKVMSNGSATGTLKMDGLALPFTATFDLDGDAHFGPARATTLLLPRPAKSSLELSLHVDLTNDFFSSISGTVVQRLRGAVIARSHIAAGRAAFSATNKVPTTPDITSKPYTLVFKHRATQPGLTAADYPQGDGYATGTVKADGTMTFTGKLADNTAFTTTAALSQDKHWPLYLPLYAGSQGCIAADVKVDTAPDDTDMAASAVYWFRPWQNVQWYPWGWPEGIAVDVIGSKYVIPFPGLKPVDAVNGNASLTFADGNLSAVIIKNVNLSPTHVASKAPVTDASFTFALNAATGMMSGNLTHTDGSKPLWQGVLFEKGANKGGYGYFMTLAQKKVNGLGEGGGVKLLVKPNVE